MTKGPTFIGPANTISQLPNQASSHKRKKQIKKLNNSNDFLDYASQATLLPLLYALRLCYALSVSVFTLSCRDVRRAYCPKTDTGRLIYYVDEMAVSIKNTTVETQKNTQWCPNL